MIEPNEKLKILDEVFYLIDTHQEGGYWDFKREWHSDDGELLYDIICMANNLFNRDAYLIIGVDEENDFRIRDVSDNQHRRNTQSLVTFLRDKKFAGEVRPTVFVNTYTIDKCNIDVIVIKNSHSTPFFITRDWKGILAYHIYTRIQDTNTARDKSADLDKTEYLWKKRFYIDEPPIEKFKHYLDDYSSWMSFEDESAESMYYANAPEFTITTVNDETRAGHVFYMFSQTDSTPHWYVVNLKYYQITLETFQGISLDGGRCFVIAPQRKSLELSSHDNWKHSYVCYVKNTLRYKLNEFYQRHGSNDQYDYNCFLKMVLVFDSEEEHEEFQEYVMYSRAQYMSMMEAEKQKKLAYIPEIPGMNTKCFEEEIRNAYVLQTLLSEFRAGNDKKMEVQ